MGLSGERQLLTHLFEEYNSLTRPVQNYSHPVTVRFHISLNQILDLVSRSEHVMD